MHGYYEDWWGNLTAEVLLVAFLFENIYTNIKLYNVYKLFRPRGELQTMWWENLLLEFILQFY